MPTTMAATWVGMGATIAIAILIVALLIPRPQGDYSIVDLIDRAGDELQEAADVAFLDDEGGEGEGQQSGPASEDAQQGAAEDPDQQGQPGGQHEGDQKDSSAQDGDSGQPDPQSQGEGQSSGPSQQQQSGDSQQSGKSEQSQQSSQQQNDQQSQQGQPQNQSGQQQNSQGQQQSQDGQQSQQQSDSRQQSDSQQKHGQQQNGQQDQNSPDQSSQQNGEQSQQSADEQAAQNQESQDAEGQGDAESDSADAETPETPEATPPDMSSVFSSIGDLFKWIMYGLMAIATLWLLYVYRESIANFFTRLWNELLGLFGRRTPETTATEDLAAPEAPLRPFAAFQNPFASGAAPKHSPSELVRYTFEALQAWGFEHGCPRSPDQTPMEYGQQLRTRKLPFASEASDLSQLYARVAYAGYRASPENLALLEKLWRKMGQAS